MLSIAIGIVTLAFAHAALSGATIPSICSQPYYDRTYVVSLESAGNGGAWVDSAGMDRSSLGFTLEIMRALKRDGGPQCVEQMAMPNGDLLGDVIMFDEYSGLCGITQHELSTILRPCVEEYADVLNITLDEAYAELKRNYDGYHFSENSQDVYAPYSLLNALNDKSTRHYWFESGTMTSLIEHLKHYPLTTALEYDGVEVGLNEFNVPCEDAETPIPLLYQGGYLTIDSYDPLLKTYTLHFPNLEVREGMVSGLMPLILKRSTADGNSLVRNMASSLFKGNLPGALSALRSYIAKIPYDIITKQEWADKASRESFYKLLIYMAFSMLNSIVDTEVKSVLGRADVVIKTRNDIYVLELKVDDTVSNALAQIDSKGYTIPYEPDGHKVTKCGVCISSDARNIVHWRAVDEKGEIVDEQQF